MPSQERPIAEGRRTVTGMGPEAMHSIEPGLSV